MSLFGIHWSKTPLRSLSFAASLVVIGDERFAVLVNYGCRICKPLVGADHLSFDIGASLEAQNNLSCEWPFRGAEVDYGSVLSIESEVLLTEMRVFANVSFRGEITRLQRHDSACKYDRAQVDSLFSMGFG
jgi:hypothetical protein